VIKKDVMGEGRNIAVGLGILIPCAYLLTDARTLALG
jgi:hypothetical protein